VIAWEGETVMPSVVGLDPSGKLLVGTPARNQLAAYPERTVRSIKRRMGTDQEVMLGDQGFTPPEVSAHILKELARRAASVTGLPIRKAVITVPAFFRDAQRQATRLAGEIAGLEVVHLLNEPTAAALAFAGDGSGTERLLLVYDLGGGTFDASLVLTDGTLTEVLASHGDVQLGGDDFDRLVADSLAGRLQAAGHPDPRGDPTLAARLIEAAETARRRLTEEVATRVREEFFGRDRERAPLHLDEELTRDELEGLIAPLIERTLDSVHQTLTLAGRTLAQIDDVLLVGGATRTPLVGARLRSLTGRTPRRDVHPDLCVALGAAVQAARLAGQETHRVLVDVTPYSFGPSHLGELDGQLSSDCYTPVIERGTPLPVRRSSSYYTMFDDQALWDVRIYQGEDPDAHKNILVGRFMAEGFSAAPAGNEIVCRMSLSLDGILDVEVIEKRTGKKKKVRIEHATAALSPEQVEAARRRAEALWAGDEERPRLEEAEEEEEAAGEAHGEELAGEAAADSAWVRNARDVIARGRRLLPRMAAEDRDEFAELAAEAEDAIARQDEVAAAAVLADLVELVHYVEEA
jgi:molecular chaperone DnaK (HSP70)